MKHLLSLMLIVSMAGVMSAKAQTALDLNEGVQVSEGAQEGEFVVSWWGKTGRTYFVQQSFDLMTWQYVPVIESGAEAVCGLNVSCSETRQFWKLRYTDAPTGGNAQTADFDGDGLGNLDELYYGADPFKADSDDDSLTDYAEVMTHFTNPLLADTDGDTLSDSAEINLHLTSPTSWDTDGDNLSDGAEVLTHGSNPLSQDSDSDGLSDAAEINTYQTNPNAADSDADGITDKSEIKQGANANSASSRPAFESVEVGGNGEAGERKTEQVTLTLPEGVASYFVVIAVQSDEYPGFTGTASEYDDVVDWKITPAGGAVIEGEKHVNELHADWEQSQEEGTSFLGLSPVAIVATKIIKGKASGTTSVQIELGAKNVSDGALPSTVAAMVMPVDIMQPQLAAHPGVGPLESVSTVRFCRWRDAFQDANGNDTNGVLKTDFIASDPDRCVVRLPDAVVDPAKAWVEVQVTGITGVTIHTTDTGKLLLTQTGGYWESKPLIFVADPEDDQSYNGVGVQDGQNATAVPDNDQTRLAGFGAKIQIKFHPKGQNAALVLDAATLMQPLQTVKVALNVVTRDGAAADAGQKQIVQADFDRAKLIYRQIGYDLVQQGAIADHVLPATIRGLIQPSDWLDGNTRTAANATPANTNMIEYLKNVSAGDDIYHLYWFAVTGYTGAATGITAAGEASGTPGDAALIVLKNEPDNKPAAAHELGHCLGLSHPPLASNHNQFLMRSPLRPWIADHLDAKRFRFSDILVPKTVTP